MCPWVMDGRAVLIQALLAAGTGWPGEGPRCGQRVPCSAEGPGHVGGWFWATRAWPVPGAGNAVLVPGMGEWEDWSLSRVGGPGRAVSAPLLTSLSAVCSAAAGGLRRDELHNEVLHKGGGGGVPVPATAPLLGGSPEKEGGGAASGDDFSELPRGRDGLRGPRAGPGSRNGLGWGQ